MSLTQQAKVTLRLETPEDYQEVDNLTREAFWNNFQQGCDEHYLLHKLRDHQDYVKELSFVAVLDRNSNEEENVEEEVEKRAPIVGSIAYSKSKIVQFDGQVINTLTFGPISVHPSYQKRDVGGALIRHTAKLAQEMNFEAIVIFGDPAYYSRFGFRIGEKYDLRTPSNMYAVALQIMTLQSTSVNKNFSGHFMESQVFEELPFDDVEEFDKNFPPKVKQFEPSQARFELLRSMCYPVVNAFEWNH